MPIVVTIIEIEHGSTRMEGNMKRALEFSSIFALVFAGICSLAVGAQTQEHPRLMVQAAPGRVASDCVFSHDGRTALTDRGQGIALLWDAATGSELQVYRAEWPIQYMALSANNQKVLTISGIDDNNTVQLWDVSTGKELTRFTPPSKVKDFMGFSPDGSQVTIVTQVMLDGKGGVRMPSDKVNIQVWSLETGKEIQHTIVQGPAILNGVLALSPDGSKLLAGISSGSRLFDVKTGEMLRQFPSQKWTVEGVRFSRDGRRVLTDDIAYFSTVFDVETGTEIGVFKDSETGLIMKALNPDEHAALTVRDDPTHLVPAKGCESFVGYGERFVNLSYAADGHGIWTMNKGGTTWRWDAETGKATLRPSKPGDGTDAIFSPDGRLVLRYLYSAEQGVWDLETGKEILTLDGNSVGVAAFDPVGHSFLVTTNGAMVKLWDLNAGKELHSFFAHTEWRPRILYPEGDMDAAVGSIAVSPDGKKVLTGDLEGTIELWNMETGWQLQKYNVHTKSYQLALAFSPDGRRMLTEDANNTSVVRNVMTGWTLRHFNAASSPSFSADWHRVLMGTSVWHVDTGKEIQRFATHSRNAVAGRLSPDGRRVLMASDDGAVGLWDVESGKLLASLYCFLDGSWAVIDSENRFDTGKLDSNVALHWIVGSDPMQVLPLNAFKDRYYAPRLLARILSGEKLPPVRQDPVIDK